MLTTKNRPVNSSKFEYTADTSLVSYVPKKGKNVILMSTLHRDGRICGQEHQKPEIIMDYNATKGGVDNMDKLVTAYSCKRRSLRLCHLDGTEPRVEQREAPEETPLSRGTGKSTGETSNPE
ncbi:piggyBac transposable element-derived protein 4-like [Scomber scombrus]|uniref:PiggyBac transposable element-derived protein 4-like n=1 Tax=Scomber scombrus TaxID=13677 RepID=A0AAV1QGQ1_SCOSC